MLGYQRAHGQRWYVQALIAILLVLTIFGFSGPMQNAAAAESTISIQIFDCGIGYDPTMGGTNPGADCTTPGYGITMLQMDANGVAIADLTASPASSGMVTFTLPIGVVTQFTEDPVADSHFYDCSWTDPDDGTAQSEVGFGPTIAFGGQDGLEVECYWYIGTDGIAEVPVPAIDLVKTADVEYAQLGDTVTYTFTVTNTGNVPFDSVVINDGMDGLQWVTDPELGSLAPGYSASATATYVVTELNVGYGSIHNVADVTAVPDALCECPNEVDTAEADVTIGEAPATATATASVTPEPCETDSGNPATPTADMPESGLDCATPDVFPTPVATEQPNDPKGPVVTGLPNTGDGDSDERTGFGWFGIVALLGATGAFLLGSKATRGNERGRSDR